MGEPMIDRVLVLAVELAMAMATDRMKPQAWTPAMMPAVAAAMTNDFDAILRAVGRDGDYGRWRIVLVLDVATRKCAVDVVPREGAPGVH